MCGSFPCPLLTWGMILMLSSRRRRPVPVIHGGSRRTYDLLYRQICSVVVGKLVMVLSYDLCFSCWAGFNDQFVVAIILIDG